MGPSWLSSRHVEATISLLAGMAATMARPATASVIQIQIIRAPRYALLSIRYPTLLTEPLPGW